MCARQQRVNLAAAAAGLRSSKYELTRERERKRERKVGLDFGWQTEHLAILSLASGRKQQQQMKQQKQQKKKKSKSVCWSVGFIHFVLVFVPSIKVKKKLSSHKQNTNVTKTRNSSLRVFLLLLVDAPKVDQQQLDSPLVCFIRWPHKQQQETKSNANVEQEN